jgi:Recombination endonuclease VII
MPKLDKLFTRKQINFIRDELIQAHGNQCAICKKPRSAFNKRFSVDHSHTTGKVRGLLCYRCNKFLVGRQTVESALQVLKYLLKYDIPMSKSFNIIEELELERK